MMKRTVAAVVVLLAGCSSNQGATGPKGEPGPAGERGLQGVTGSGMMATIAGADNAERRWLSVTNVSSGTFATAIQGTTTAFHITHVTAVATGGTTFSIAIQTSATVRDSTIRASGSPNSYAL